jgi:hypothetical protein
MANYSSTNRPAYVWDATNSVWVPIGTGPHTHSVADVSNAVTLGGGSVIQPGNANVKGLAIAGAASQTANLQEWQTSGFTPVAYVDPSGNFSTTGSITSNNNYYAGKNLILNGNFDVWARGTSFVYTSSTAFSADHWYDWAASNNSRQSFSSVPEIPGGKYFLRSAGGAAGGYHALQNLIEDGHTYLSGQTVTVSFWAKAFAGGPFNMAVFTALNNDQQLISNTFTITSTWQKFTATYNIPVYNNSGALYRYLRFYVESGNSITLDLAQVQMEIGSVATPFTRFGGTLSNEVSACQRWYQRVTTALNYGYLANIGYGCSSTVFRTTFSTTTPMRVPPTAIEYAALGIDNGGSVLSVTSASIFNSGLQTIAIQANVASGLSQGVAYALTATSVAANSYLAVSSEFV